LNSQYDPTPTAEYSLEQDHCWFKRIARKNRPATRDIIIIALIIIIIIK
jgi:hypothetical protein